MSFYDNDFHNGGEEAQHDAPLSSFLSTEPSPVDDGAKTYAVVATAKPADTMSDLANRIIVTAGKDREDRLILVANGCYFPDSKNVDYDELLKYLRALDDVVGC